MGPAKNREKHASGRTVLESRLHMAKIKRPGRDVIISKVTMVLLNYKEIADRRS